MGEYLRIIRSRFTGTTDLVPWELDDKDTAYKFVDSRGFRTPKRIRTGSVTDALDAGRAFGDQFVVKQPNRHSAKGVYVLERLGDDRYFELFSMRELRGADVIASGPEPDYWLTEELVPSTVIGRLVPLDYKVYAFRGMVTHVMQIDRNIYPPRVAFFDGAFIPLRPDIDYFTDPDRWLPEQPVIPRQAGKILQMASRLSAALDTAFVRVDCYDGESEPVFGEFTFAPGADDIGMLKYSPRIIASLDDAITGHQVPALSGFAIDLLSFTNAVTRSTLVGNAEILARLSAGGLQGDRRYAPNILRYLTNDSTRAIFTLAAHVVGWMNGDGSRAFGIQALLRSGGAHITGTNRLGEFEDAALAFHNARSDGNPWHTARAAEVKAAQGDQAAIEVLRKLASTGYEHAIRVVESHYSS